MKRILIILIALIVCISCNRTNKTGTQIIKNYKSVDAVVDTNFLDIQLKNFEREIKSIKKELSDSAARIHPNDVDFSDLTSGIKRNYDECRDEFTKILLGYELAENYFIHFDGSKNPKYPKMAEPLFYSFICYKDGVVASRYMKLDLKRIQFMAKEWNNFSEKDKETLMFYGLLRGFDNGLPDMLKNVE
jgi:hypothetical protein